ncbi:hypothetical protein PFICI_03870 [Pestalotiopsis fici W106-1]|uniref:SET domain-containing protein n=1 Tax=Pestalotiopsis fici (strain W106-1 / CGMCC3.15140) TaxID=1229662 RepID=W3XIJ6_PESFW|nr:uncharacterized protein PFICI_03870 [Pestalotiopsis fici W106-1]ETS85845.1 hypothetical protein PFICI_03870 [Pestalotiopsis fici W106-1]
MKQDVAYEVLEVTGKDMALVATRNIEAGERIMASTASIMVDRNLIKHVPETLIDLEVGAIDSLPEEHRREYLNLSTHYHTTEHSERISRIILYNSFDISLDEVLGGVQDNLTEFRFKPNAGYHFDIDTFTHNVYAVRPIFAGEEITTSYIDPVRTREERSQQLEQSWHFKCSCPSCSQKREMIAVSDARVLQIQYLQEQLRNGILAPSTATGMAELLISLYEQEGLWLVIDEAYTLAALQYNGIGEPWLAMKYARLAIQSGIRSSGIMDKYVRDNMALAENPWEHWSWMAKSRPHW